MQEARDLHLAANGFNIHDYEARTFTIGIFGLALKFPNTEARKRAVPHCIVAGAGHGNSPFPSMAFCTCAVSSSAVRSGSIAVIGLSAADNRSDTA